EVVEESLVIRPAVGQAGRHAPDVRAAADHARDAAHGVLVVSEEVIGHRGTETRSRNNHFFSVALRLCGPSRHEDIAYAFSATARIESAKRDSRRSCSFAMGIRRSKPPTSVATIAFLLKT